jgi:hypothetical protein
VQAVWVCGLVSVYSLSTSTTFEGNDDATAIWQWPRPRIAATLGLAANTDGVETIVIVLPAIIDPVDDELKPKVSVGVSAKIAVLGAAEKPEILLSSMENPKARKGVVSAVVWTSKYMSPYAPCATIKSKTRKATDVLGETMHRPASVFSSANVSVEPVGSMVAWP